MRNLSRTILCLLIAICFCEYTEGLRCWTCENVDAETCRKTGHSEQCDDNEHVCETEMRNQRRGNRLVAIIVSTGCKQGVACKNNNEQNDGSAAIRSQCNRDREGSACRCCCSGPNCNKRKRNLLCYSISKLPRQQILFDFKSLSIPARIERTCPEYPVTPENGARYCIGGFSLRSYCKFTCDEGHTMVGSDMSICVQRGNSYVWNRGAPTCVRNDICAEYPDEPTYGFMECSGNREIGTICGFACNFGFALRGSATTTCVKDGNTADWSEETPTCVPFCDISEISPPPNGERTCDGEGEIGSVCTFTCRPDFKFVGRKYSHCLATQEGGAGWSNPVPKCLPMCKDSLPTPNNGFKNCRGRGELGSRCIFNCQNNYRLVGERTVSCIENEEGVFWSQKSPICEPVCGSLPMSPEYGNVECSGLSLESTCSFECQSGFRLIGQESTTCVRISDRAAWEGEPPICEPICPLLPESLDNGNMACDGTVELGSVCEFSCEVGFRLIGHSAAECITESGAEALWSSPFPTCIPVCRELPNEVENGQIFCEGDGKIGTTCHFDCNQEYEISGESFTTCVEYDGKARWSHEPAACKPIPKCEMLSAPENGRMECTGAGQLGTNCQFFCNVDHKIVGKEFTSCFREGDEAFWTSKAPICKEIEPECAPLGDFPHGNIACNSDILRKGTTCKFQCSEEGYELLSEHGAETKCIGYKKNLTWTMEKPCCVECKNVKKDIVIMMDSSDSIRPNQWEIMKRFVQNIVKKFNVSENDVQFCVFQFSTVARSDGNMFFGAYKKGQLIRQIGKMPRIGRGTKTDKGLNYAYRRLQDRKNRKDVDDMVWVLTDGETDDLSALEKEAKRLRDANVEILALAINPTDNFVEQMTKMTGSEEKVLVAESMKSLGQELASRVAVKICQESCPA